MKDTKKEIPGFMIYREAAIMLSLLSDEAAGQVIKAAAFYFLRGVVPNDIEETASQVLEVLQESIDRCNDKYGRILARNTINGKKGGRPKGKSQKEPKENPEETQKETQKEPKENQEKPNHNHNPTPNSNHNQSQSNNPDNACLPEQEFPTDREIFGYAERIGLDGDSAEQLIRQMEADDWQINGEPIRNWKALLKSRLRWQKEKEDGGNPEYGPKQEERVGIHL